MSDTSSKRRTQAERRAETRQALLDSATRLYGEKGYADTSLEEIAADCGLTIRPIYHYFGNKKALFSAVNAVMEERILESMKIGKEGEQWAVLVENWRAYLELCDDAGFRRIVLVDSPNILGRERWSSSPVIEKARLGLSTGKARSRRARYREDLVNAVVMGAFTEAALMIAEAEDVEMAKGEALAVMGALVKQLRSGFK